MGDLNVIGSERVNRWWYPLLLSTEINPYGGKMPQNSSRSCPQFLFNGLIRPVSISRPERWANIPDAATSIPGVWSNLLTFSGGPRACIGFRFSLVEWVWYICLPSTLWFWHVFFFFCVWMNRTKALLFTLIRAFEFDLAVSANDLGVKPVGFQRPVLLTDPNNSNQMPLILRPVSSNL